MSNSYDGWCLVGTSGEAGASGIAGPSDRVRPEGYHPRSVALDEYVHPFKIVQDSGGCWVFGGQVYYDDQEPISVPAIGLAAGEVWLHFTGSTSSGVFAPSSAELVGTPGTDDTEHKYRKVGSISGDIVDQRLKSDFFFKSKSVVPVEPTCVEEDLWVYGSGYLGSGAVPNAPFGQTWNDSYGIPATCPLKNLYTVAGIHADQEPLPECEDPEDDTTTACKGWETLFIGYVLINAVYDAESVGSLIGEIYTRFGFDSIVKEVHHFGTSQTHVGQLPTAPSGPVWWTGLFTELDEYYRLDQRVFLPSPSFYGMSGLEAANRGLLG